MTDPLREGFRGTPDWQRPTSNGPMYQGKTSLGPAPAAPGAPAAKPTLGYRAGNLAGTAGRVAMDRVAPYALPLAPLANAGSYKFTPEAEKNTFAPGLTGAMYDTGATVTNALDSAAGLVGINSGLRQKLDDRIREIHGDVFTKPRLSEQKAAAAAPAGDELPMSVAPLSGPAAPVTPGSEPFKRSMINREVAPAAGENPFRTAANESLATSQRLMAGRPGVGGEAVGAMMAAGAMDRRARGLSASAGEIEREQGTNNRHLNEMSQKDVYMHDARQNQDQDYDLGLKQIASHAATAKSTRAADMYKTNEENFVKHLDRLATGPDGKIDGEKRNRIERQARAALKDGGLTAGDVDPGRFVSGFLPVSEAAERVKPGWFGNAMATIGLRDPYIDGDNPYRSAPARGSAEQTMFGTQHRDQRGNRGLSARDYVDASWLSGRAGREENMADYIKANGGNIR